VEVPLAEESEKYRVELSADVLPGPVFRETAEPRIVLDAKEMEPFMTADISTVGVAIIQVGAAGQSPPLKFDIIL